MNQKLIPVLLALVVTGFVPTSAEAEKVSPYGNALASYYDGDYEQADKLLSAIIEQGTDDPRVFFFRGLSRHSLKKIDNAKADFAEGARLEATGRSGARVSRSLERIQGRGRILIEDYRQKARQAAAGETIASRRKAHAIREIYSSAREAWFRGDAAATRELLDPIIERGTNDPRHYYFRGLALDRLGESNAAAADFRLGVRLETSFDRRVDVDRALEKVQGSPRRSLERHRQETLNIVRKQDAERRRQLIAQIRARNSAQAAFLARAGTPTPGTAPGNTVATTGTNPGTSPMPGTAPGTAAAGTSTPPDAGTTTPRAAVGAATIDLAWLPPETALVVRVAPRQIWESEFVRQFHDLPPVKQALAEVQKEIKLAPSDIESITLGAPSPDPATAAAIASPLGPAALQNSKFEQELVVVARTRLPFDPSIIEGRDEFAKADHGGKSYFKSNIPDAPSIYLADSKTIVMALDDALTKAIDRGPQVDPRPEFAFLDTSKQLIIGFVPDDPNLLTGEMDVEEDTGSPALNRFGKAAKDNLLGVALSIGVQDSLLLEVSLLCVDEATSAELNDAFKELLEEGKGIYNLAKAGLPPATAGLGDSLLRTVRSSNRTEVFAFSLTITQNTTQRIIASAEELGQQIMGAVMQQMMAGGPGQPGNPSAPNVPPNLGNAGAPGNDDGNAEPPMATRQAAALNITGTGQISNTTEFDFDKNEQKPKAIELVLDLIGDDAVKASGFGFVELTAAKDNNGTDLVQRVRSSSPFSDSPGFVKINRNDFFLKHPDNGCKVVVAFEPPATAPTHIASAEGKLKLQTVDESQDVLIDDIKGQLGMNIQNATLEGAGYQFKLEESEQKFGDETKKQWTLTWVNAVASKVAVVQAGGGEGPQRPEVVDADGNVITTFSGTSSSSFGNQASFAWSMFLDDEKPIPDGAKLRIKLNTKTSILDVPFKVENVEIKSGN